MQPAGQAGAQPPSRPWRRWWIRWPLITLVVWLVICGLLAIGLPLGLQRLALPKAAEAIGRPVTADRIRFDPFRWRLTANRLGVGGVQGQPDLLQIGAIEVDLSIRSLRHLAPVFERVRIEQPVLSLARNRDGSFDFDDIRARTAAPSGDKPPSKDGAAPPRFIAHDVSLTDGLVRIDDRRTGNRHEIAAIAVLLPFLSSLPRDAATKVRPSLTATVDGSPLNVTGEALPFQASREGRFTVALQALTLAPYLKLSPTPLGFRLSKGQLSLNAVLGFTQETARDRLTVDGKARIDDLAIDAVAGDRLLETRRIEVAVAGVEPLVGRYPIASLAVDRPVVTLVRESDGRLPLIDALTMPADRPAARPGRQPATEPAQSREPAWSVARTVIHDGAVTWLDRAVAPAVTLRQHGIDVEIGSIGNRQPKPAGVKVVLAHQDDGRLAWNGDLDLAKAQASGRVELKLPGITPYLPYVADRIGDKLGSGAVTASAAFEAGWRGDLSLALKDGQATIESLHLALPDDPLPEPAVHVGRVAVEGVELALADRQLAIRQATVGKAAVRMIRDRDGRIDLMRLLDGAEPTAAASRPASADSDSAASEWKVDIARVTLDDNRVDWQDRAAATPVTVAVHGVSGSIDRVGTRLDRPSRLDLEAAIGEGSLTVAGDVTAAPVGLDLQVGWRGLAIEGLDPYLARTTALAIRRGQASGDGRLRFGDDRLRFAGKLGIDRVSVAERRNDVELLRWDSLAVADIDSDLAIPASGKSPAGEGGESTAPDRVTVGEIALDGAFARIEISAEGRLNIRELTRPMAEAGAPPTGQTDTPEPAPAAGADATAKDGDGDGDGARSASSPSRQSMRIRLGQVRLDNGSASFNDYFIQPNLSVGLSDLKGTVASMATDATEPAAVDLSGKVEGSAPITISGKVSPFGPSLSADITASARGIDLPVFTPYSGKYAGYAIEKGKLSLDARYRVENDQLEATNRILLDQLTFGEKVESKDALDLPIQFAIDLLKNRKGEIDLSLPITGSLNDPQFSVGDIVWNAVANLFKKIVTSPFSALAAAFGGGEELSFIEFAPGTADLKADSRKRLESVAKALVDRPALKLEVTGRMDPAAEADAFGRARLEERLQASRTGDGGGREQRAASSPGGQPGPRGSGSRASPASGGATASAGGAAGTTSARATAIPAEERAALLAKLAESLQIDTGVDTRPSTSAASAAPQPSANRSEAAQTFDPPPAASPSPVDPVALERRLVERLAADADAQRALAIRRSQVARDWLATNGKIAGDRIFLMAPKVAVTRGTRAPAPAAESPAGDGQAMSAAPRAPQCTRDCAEFSLR